MCTWILLIKILHFYTVQMVPINCIAAKINVEITFNISLQKFRIFLEKFSFDWKPIFREHNHCYQVEIEFQKRKNFSDWFHASEIVWEYQREEGGVKAAFIISGLFSPPTNKFEMKMKVGILNCRIMMMKSWNSIVKKYIVTH